MTSGNYFNGDDTIVKGDDGSIEGVKIAAIDDGGTNRLAVDATLSVSPATTLGVPSFSSKARVDFSSTKIDLNRANSSFTTLYTYSGSGKLAGFALKFNSTNVVCRLEVDGEEIFAIDLDELNPLFALDIIEGGGINWFNWDANDEVLVFQPTSPIVYTTNITIQARANSNSSFRDMDYSKVTLTKET